MRKPISQMGHNDWSHVIRCVLAPFILRDDKWPDWADGVIYSWASRLEGYYKDGKPSDAI